ncbi:MAG: transcription termination factor NusA [Chloroflexota bacterium]
MSKNEFALAFNEVLEEKQLPKDIILNAIESAMVSAYRRAVNASSAQHVEAKVDPDTGKVSIFAEKEVVEDVQSPETEVLLEVARKYDPDCQLNDMVIVESTPEDFGRVAAQTARQVIQQRIREAERNMQLEYFQRQAGEIVSGVVQAVNNQGVTIGLDMKAEGVMPNNQKIANERFRVHDRVRAIIMEVKDAPRGPQIILSRAHRNFLRRLLENEVPEIYHGIVEIRAIAREPGHRAKVAVSATQAGVDPVGACVGIKGVRIQAIVKELHDEKIDIIEWNPDQVIYISKAISPARVSGVYLSDGGEGGKTATVVVTEDQLSLAIGRDGQNARLAAKLTGWRIDIKSLAEAAGDAISKLQSDGELAAMIPGVVETVPDVEAILAKKAEGRAISPEEYSAMLQFVDRVERRTIQRQEDEQRQEEERLAGIRAEIPAVAFETSMYDMPLKEHLINIITEAEITTVGDLMLTMKLDPDKVLGLPGVGPKSLASIEEAISQMTFPGPEPAPVAEVETAVPAAVEAEAEAESESEAEAVAEAPAAQPEVQKEAPMKVRDGTEEEPERDLSIEEMFAVVQSEAAQPAPEGEEEDESGERGKKKSKKKKHVELEYDPDLGEVVSHKKRKRGGDDWEEW